MLNFNQSLIHKKMNNSITLTRICEAHIVSKTLVCQCMIMQDHSNKKLLLHDVKRKNLKQYAEKLKDSHIICHCDNQTICGIFETLRSIEHAKRN
jgi:hypothetical protein